MHSKLVHLPLLCSSEETGTQAKETGAKLQVHPAVRLGMFMTPLAGYRLLFTEQQGRTPKSGVIFRLSRSIQAELLRYRVVRRWALARVPVQPRLVQFNGAPMGFPVGSSYTNRFSSFPVSSLSPAMYPGMPCLGKPFP